MSDTPWTPGPWTLAAVAEDGASWFEVRGDADSGGWMTVIADMVDHVGDARLIAAAPDMAEALEMAEAAMNYMGDILNNMDAVLPEDEAATEAAFEAVRAALAKAKGATQ